MRASSFSYRIKALVANLIKKGKEKKEEEKKKPSSYRTVSMKFLAVIVITSIALCLKFHYALVRY